MTMNDSGGPASSVHLISAPIAFLRRWWPHLALGTLLPVLVLRETGVLSVRLASLQTQHRFVTTSTSRLEGRAKGEFEDMTLKAELAVTPHPGVPADVAERLRGMVFGQARTNGVVRIAFKEGKLTGCYWLPLFKRGHCTARAECEWFGGRGRGVSSTKMSIETDVDARAVGIMSVHEFKAQFSEAIADRIAQVLRDNLEKK
jgi:hypothetical protein